ncbi:hypothetical protein ACU686_16060 [Yinghuangia aomiensis]
MHRYHDAGESALLFATNVAAIVATGTTVFLAYGIRVAAHAAGLTRRSPARLHPRRGLRGDAPAHRRPLTTGTLAVARDRATRRRRHPGRPTLGQRQQQRDHLRRSPRRHHRRHRRPESPRYPPPTPCAPPSTTTASPTPTWKSTTSAAAPPPRDAGQTCTASTGMPATKSTSHCRGQRANGRALGRRSPCQAVLSAAGGRQAPPSTARSTACPAIVRR